MKIHGGDTVQGYYLHIPNHIAGEVKRASDEHILGVTEGEYINYLFTKYSLKPIEKDNSRKILIEKLKEWRQVQGILGPVDHEITQLKIGYPIKINEKTSEVFEMGWAIMPAHNWELDKLNGYIYAVVANSKDDIKNEVSLLDRVISNKNNLIKEDNLILKEKIIKILKHRKEKVAQDKEDFKKLINEIDIPLEVVNKNAVKSIDLNIKPQIKILLPPRPKKKDNYKLDRSKVLSVIEIIDNLLTNLEAAPDTYCKLEEEKLRNIILSSLNSVFGGKATAETFSKKGKTDIFLNIKKGCILIMECKWWRGKQTLQEAMDQLFKYLTWRENYGIIIIFSKNAGFTQLLNSVAISLQENLSYKKGFRELSKSHFESHHIFPDDEEKTIEIHTLIYNLYSA